LESLAWRFGGSDIPVLPYTISLCGKYPQLENWVGMVKKTRGLSTLKTVLALLEVDNDDNDKQ